MAETAQTEPLNTETGERHAADPEYLEIPSYPGMIPIKGKKKNTISLVFTMIFLILNITMFMVGITSTGKCPIQPNILIYLIVAGILGTATKALLAVYFCKDGIPFIQHTWHAPLVMELIWGLVGSYWVYSIYEPNFIQVLETPYCDKTLYFLAFWLLTFQYIFGILLVIVKCSVFCGALCAGMTSTAKQERN